MSSSPMCVRCGNYTHHGPVMCSDCLAVHDAEIRVKVKEEILKMITDAGART